MLLLYRIRTPLLTKLHSFTFHYASTLSHRKLWDRGRLPKFTFHYASTLSVSPFCPVTHTADLHSIMLLLYHRTRWRFSLNWQIYIPLCFYFIWIGGSFLPDFYTDLHSIMLLLYPVPADTPSFFQANLHSIMLLLYLNEEIDDDTFLPIYIPLCFYFIGKDDLVLDMDSIIYIPLCFYFITVFHCVSIACFWFTFHYASTLSESDLSKDACRQDLHSIMLLLYPIPFFGYVLISSIYIPLCFYFIQMPWPWSLHLANLHSIMLLLYRKGTAVFHQ